MSCRPDAYSTWNGLTASSGKDDPTARWCPKKGKMKASGEIVRVDTVPSGDIVTSIELIQVGAEVCAGSRKLGKFHMSN